MGPSPTTSTSQFIRFSRHRSSATDGVPARLTSCAFGDDQRDVVRLFMRAESPSLVGNCGQQLRWGQLEMLSGGFQQTLFAKLLSLSIQSFRNSVGVKQEGVAGSKCAFFHCAIPLLKQANHRAGSLKPFQSAVASQEQGRRMAAVRVAQLARVIVVFGEE